MAPGNDTVCAQSLTDVTTATNRQRLTTSTETLSSPPSLYVPLPTLPFDLVPEILCRLSVKLLLQLKCICKSWKALISDPKFAKKHLRMSTTYCAQRHHLMVGSTNTSRELLLWDSRISSIFSNVSSTSTVPQLQLTYPETPLYNRYSNRYAGCAVSSCDGILLFDIDSRSPLLWNPSIRKFKILPPLLHPPQRKVHYTFGYDHFIDNYKIFAISLCIYKSEVDVKQNKSKVSVYTLGTDSWRWIEDFPYERMEDFPHDDPIRGPGMFVSGTVNWLVLDASVSFSRVIVSLDLEKESYRKLLMPDLKKRSIRALGVLRDCLCIFANSFSFFDVWVMKEYGIQESWTKLFRVPYVGRHYFYAYTKVLYISEDDQVLLDYTKLLTTGDQKTDNLRLVVYNSRNGTIEIPKIQNINDCVVPEVYVESLISPCS